MLFTVSCLLLVCACAIVYDDFRRREVGVAWLLALGVCGIARGCLSCGLRTTLLHGALNACVLAALVGLLLLWHALRGASPGSLFRTAFGAGDAVLLLLLTPLFAPAAYVRLLLAACLASLAWWCLKRPATIPFAGFLALSLMLYTLALTSGLCP